MSVRLIVVALLAAAVTTVAADDTATTTEKVVKTTFCPKDTANADKCGCAAPFTRTFPTVCPKEAGEDNLFWKADSCTDDINAFVVKGYKTKDCTAGGLTVSRQCKPVFSRAECDATTVKLYGGCTGATESCNDCKESVTFTKAATECRKWGDKYLKLADSTDCSESSTTQITFKAFTNAECTTAANPQDMTIPKACTPTRYYGKATCTDGKASFKSCAPKTDNNDCTESCDTVEVMLGKYDKKLNGETLYIDACPAADADVTFQVYADVMEYKKACTDTGNGFANATCADADVLSIKTCKDTDCTCEASEDNTKKYTAGVCTVIDGKAWMVDSCGANAVKQYSDKDCTMEIFAPKKGCSAVSYYKAECGNGDGTVKLYAGCNTAECEKNTGMDNGCKTATIFKTKDVNKACLKAGTRYYKLTEGQCKSGASSESVTFMQYNERDENNDCKGVATEVKVPLTCTATGYQKVSCTAADGKASIEECTTMSDGSCSKCKPVIEVPFKEYKQTAGGSYLYVDSCPAGAEDPVLFQVYADVKKYQLGCHSPTEATCGEKTTTTTETTETTTTTTAETTATAETTTTTTGTSGSSDSDDTGSSNDTTSNSSTDDGIIAPAHSVGVLALVLCFLACVY